MEDAKISVIVPVYKVEAYLPKCIESIIAQTYQNLEILLIDDGSPDNCGKICDEYAARDARIRVIHKENGGVSRARNTGLDAATGDYIGFADSDDWLEPEMYSVLMQDLLESGSDAAMCGETIYEDGKVIFTNNDGSVVQMTQLDARKATVRGGEMGLIWNKLYKRSAIGAIRFSPEYGCSEDLYFVYEVVLNCNKMIYRHKSLYNYFRRLGGITMSEFGYGAFGVVDVMKRMADAEQGTEVYPHCIKGYTDAAFTVLSGVITQRKCEDRFDELRSGILGHQKAILHGGLHSKKDKIKCLLLRFSPALYKVVIRKIRNA